MASKIGHGYQSRGYVHRAPVWRVSIYAVIITIVSGRGEFYAGELMMRRLLALGTATKRPKRVLLVRSPGTRPVLEQAR